jgi:ribosome-binding factor A
MNRKRHTGDELTNLAADLGHEDGGDPKDFHAKPWNAPKQASRKGLQLCAQVKDALHGALGECADEVLRELLVVDVEPAPHSGRLRVLVLAGETDRQLAIEGLQRASGFLRAAVASAVNRRYTPELVFEVIG